MRISREEREIEREYKHLYKVLTFNSIQGKKKKRNSNKWSEAYPLSPIIDMGIDKNFISKNEDCLGLINIAYIYCIEWIVNFVPIFTSEKTL